MLHRFPIHVLETILQNLEFDDIVEFSVCSKKLQEMVKKSVYMELKKMIIDLSIYTSMETIKFARRYISFDYLSLEFQIGVQVETDYKQLMGVQLVSSRDNHRNESKFVGDPIVIILRNAKYFSMNVIRLVNLKELFCYFNPRDLENSGFCGWIPVSIANLVQLESLNFYNNKLTGEIPSAIGNLVRLKELYTKFNK